MPLTPARRRGVELLDDPAVDDATRARSIADVARSNRWLGGRRAVRLALDDALRRRPRGARAPLVLDVGTGAADLASLARARGALVLGVDLAPSLVREARRRGALDHALVADALRLPLASGSVDVVVCSQLLHHFEWEDARRLVVELHRVSRGVVLISDLRRSWLAAIGFWLVSWPFRFHRVTRHDGVVSVLRGFTSAELRALVREATGREPRIVRRLGWRLVSTSGPSA
ncbi:MAG TPA: methyltransferase domain-containing protein [Gemmatimonadaceae bacterium]|nr:methyltransferase domain-containing protein [Gemmatimonadaceae bacterium]